MSTKSRLSFITLICVGLACASCSATVNSITVTPLRNTTTSPSTDPNANIVNVQASVQGGAGVTLQSPVVLRVSRLNGQGETIRRDMTNGRVENLVVPQGDLRYEVEAPYTAAFQSGTRIARKVIEEHSPVPDSCFFFDFPVHGWSGSKYLQWYEQNSQPTCGPKTVWLDRTGPNAAAAVLDSYGLKMSKIAARDAEGELTSSCFMNPPPAATFTSADFLSPDLSELAGWRNATGFDLQARGDIEGAQMLLIIEDIDGRFWGEHDANQELVYHPLPGGFAPSGMAKPAAASAIRRILVRIFVPPPVTGVLESGVTIDRICPRN